MEKKTKKGTKKLLMSVMVMVIALVGAATSTFAWFTTSAAPRVDEFQVQVSTISGLYIALDNTNGLANYYDLNYKSYITATEIYSVINPDRDRTLVPYSTFDGRTFTDFDGNVAGAGGAATGNLDYTATDRAFFSFDLYFRGNDTFGDSQIALNFDVNGAAGKKTYVSAPVNSSGVEVLSPMVNTDIPRTWINAASTPTDWIYNLGVLQTIDTTRYGKEETINVAAGDQIYDSAANALRLSFIGTDDIAVPATTTTNIWDPRSDKGYFKENFALDLRNALNDGTLYAVPDNYFDNHLIESQIANEVLVSLSTDRSDKDAGGDGFFYGKLNVKIWIDGWDGDCLNAIMSDIGRIALQFKIVE